MSLDTKAITSAMNMHFTMQEILARNIANAETPGFKRVLANVKNNAATSPDEQSAACPEISGIRLDLAQGTLRLTDRKLDVAIEGDGFFTIETENGLRYTRNGRFQLDHNLNLVTQQGEMVKAKVGMLQMPGNFQKISISATGEVLVDGSPVGEMEIVRFENEDQLTQAGHCLYSADNAMPVKIDFNDPDTNPKIRQGFLESSNINPVGELVEMIASYREFEACAKSLRALEEAAKQLYTWASS